MTLFFCFNVLAENLPGIYEFVTFCPQVRQACGVILDQKPTSPADAPEYRATIWKDNLSNSKIVEISTSKFRHIDRTFHTLHLWKQMQEGPYVVNKLPTNERMLYFNAKSESGQHHLVISRYSRNLSRLEKVILDWENFLKAQVMKINTSEFKQGFPKN